MVRERFQWVEMISPSGQIAEPATGALNGPGADIPECVVQHKSPNLPIAPETGNRRARLGYCPTVDPRDAIMISVTYQN